MGSEGIGRHKDYQRKLPLLDRRKLFIPRDVTGEPNLAPPLEGEEYGTETHELIRTLQRELGSQESFISVTPIGSDMRGHSTKGSDIDVMVLVDNTKDDNAGKKVYSIYKNEIALLKKKGILKRHVEEQFVILSQDAIKRVLYEKPPTDVSEDDKIDEVTLLRCAVIALCGPAVGPRVEEYRQMIGNMMRDMPIDECLELLRELAMTAMHLEENSKTKRLQRIPSLGRHSEAKSDKARILMWYSRIAKTLGLAKKI